jgi:hypothetical protein
MIINNESLKETFHQVATIETALTKEISQVQYNKSHLEKLVPSHIAGVYSSKLKSATEFAESVLRTSYEGAVVLLVATFERVVFSKYRTSYGSLKTVVKIHSTRPLDYFHSREKFVNDSIDRLAAIIALLEGIIDPDLMQKLTVIKDHRNYIAHGKRDSAPPAVQYSIEELTKILDDVILEIEK